MVKLRVLGIWLLVIAFRGRVCVWGIVIVFVEGLGGGGVGFE